MALLPEKGERTLSVGQTGSGKTAFNCWLMDKMPASPIVIYDTKDEPKFLQLPYSVAVHSPSQIAERIGEGEHDYIVFRPPGDILHDAAELDNFLYMHYANLPGIDAYIDEIYSFHSSGRAHKGLHALLSRGRSRGITTMMSTQRPVLLSRFALTESQQIYIFTLSHEDDRKTLNKMIPGFEDKPMLKPKEHKFYHYDVANQKLQLFNPVPIDANLQTGYIDDAIPNGDVAETDADKVRRLTWI